MSKYINRLTSAETSSITNCQSDFDETFEAVWDAIKQHDGEAQTRALERILPRMILAVQSRFGSSAKVDAEDATQSAIRTIQRRNWKFKKSEPRSWGELTGKLVTFAINKARTQLKKRREDHLPDTFEMQGKTSTPSEEAIRNEATQKVKADIDRLKTELSEIDSKIMIGKYEGCSFPEIAARLEAEGIYRTVDSIRMKWNRSVAPKLLDLFKDLDS